MRLALTALFAVLAFSAIATSGALAHPEFNNASGKTLSFSGTGGTSILRGLNLGVLGTIECEKNTSSGLVLNKSALAAEIHVEFSGKCVQLLSGNTTTCTEPIKIKLAFGELGLSLAKKAVLLLAPESGTEFVKITCGANVTTVEGTILGEFPENDKNLVKQYNQHSTKLELVFKSESNNENQAIRHFFLSNGTLMEGVELKVAGFFGGKASEEATGVVEADGGGAGAWTELKV